MTLGFSTSVTRPPILRGVSSRQHGVTLVARRPQRSREDCVEIDLFASAAGVLPAATSDESRPARRFALRVGLA
jgi:hypothetical protein